MAARRKGRIVSLQVCVGHREPMRVVEDAKLVAGFGIEGDRHAVAEGVRTARQVLLMDKETLTGLGLAPGQVRENITTADIALGSLAEGQSVALGDEVVVKITGHCAPCARMDEIRIGLKQELEGRRGMLATVVKGGTLKVGDAIRVLQVAGVS